MLDTTYEFDKIREVRSFKLPFFLLGDFTGGQDPCVAQCGRETYRPCELIEKCSTSLGMYRIQGYVDTL